MTGLETSLLELIRRTAIHLPKDVVGALDQSASQEDEGSSGRLVLSVIRDNIDAAREKSLPVTAETSSIHFYVTLPNNLTSVEFEKAAQSAVEAATKEGLLESARLDPVTEKIYKNNVGPGSPIIHTEVGSGDDCVVQLVLKGSGAENVSAQYSLPDDKINASRDLHGVRRSVLDALIQAQGNGSGPGVVGVGIGGDRFSSYALAHRQHLRPLNDRNRNSALNDLEKRILEEANSLGIGAMGFGGKSTLLSAKVGAESRPASAFFVSISYVGWTFRRQGVKLDKGGVIAEWLHADTHSHPPAAAKYMRLPTAEVLPPPVVKATKKKKSAVAKPKPPAEAARAASTIAGKATQKSVKEAAAKAAKRKTSAKATPAAATKAPATAKEPAAKPAAVAKKTTKKVVAKKAATKAEAKPVAKKSAKAVAKKTTKSAAKKTTKSAKKKTQKKS